MFLYLDILKIQKGDKIMKDKSNQIFNQLLSVTSSVITDLIKINSQLLTMPTEARDKRALEELIAKTKNDVANLELVEIDNIPPEKLKEYCNNFDPPIPYMETIITGKEYPVVFIHKDDEEKVNLFVKDYWKRQNNRDPYEIVEKMEERANHLKENETLSIEVKDEKESLIKSYEITSDANNLNYYIVDENNLKQSVDRNTFIQNVKSDVLNEFNFHLNRNEIKEKIDFKNRELLDTLYNNEKNPEQKKHIEEWIEKGEKKQLTVEALTYNEVPLKDIEIFAKQNNISYLTTESINKNNPYLLVDETDSKKVLDYIKQYQAAHGYKRSPEKIASSIRDQIDKLKDKEQLELKIVNKDSKVVDGLKIKKNGPDISYEALNNGKYVSINEAVYLNRLKNAVNEDHEIKLSIISNRKKEEKEKNTFLKKVYENTSDREEKLKLKDLYIKVEEGNARIDILDTNGVPFNEIKNYANTNGISVFSTQVLGVENQTVIVEDKNSFEIQEFITEYMQKETEERTISNRERSLDSKSDDDDLQEDDYNNFTQQDDFFEEIEDNEVSEKKEKQKKKKKAQEKKSQEQRYQEEQKHQEEYKYAQGKAYGEQKENESTKNHQKPSANEGSSETRKNTTNNYLNSQKEETYLDSRSSKNNDNNNLNETYHKYNSYEQTQHIPTTENNKGNGNLIYSSTTSSREQSSSYNNYRNSRENNSNAFGNYNNYDESKNNYEKFNPYPQSSSHNNTENRTYINNRNESKKSSTYKNEQKQSVNNSYGTTSNVTEDYTSVKRLREETQRGMYLRDSSNSFLHSAGVIGTGSAIPSESKPADNGMRLTDTTQKMNVISNNSQSSFSVPTKKSDHDSTYESLKIKDSDRLVSAESYSSNTYKMSAMNRCSSFTMPSASAQAVARFAISSATEEFHDLQASRELKKLSPFISMGSATATLIPTTLFNATAKQQIFDIYQKGDFESLNSILKKNNMPTISIKDKKSVDKAMDSLFGKKAGLTSKGSAGSLSKLGIDVRRMSKNQIAQQLMKHGMGRDEAAKTALSLINAKNQHFLGNRMMKKSTGQMMRATGQMMRMAFKGNESAQEAMATLRAMQAVYEASVAGGKVVYKFAEITTRYPRKIVNRTVINPVKNVVNRTVVNPLNKKFVDPAKQRVHQFDVKIKKSKPVTKINSARRKINIKTKQTVKKINPSRIIRKNYIKKVGLQRYRRQNNVLNKMKDFVSKGVNKVTGTILKLKNGISKIKMIIYAVIAVFLLLVVAINFIISGEAVSLITNIGFFEYDNEDNDNVYETITGMNYVDLLKQDKQWIESLQAIGVGEGISNIFKSKTYVSDLQYTEDFLDIADYCSMQGLVYDASSKAIRGPEPFTNAPEAAYKYLKEIDGGSELSFSNGTSSASTHTSNIQEILSMSAVFFKQNFSGLNEPDDSQNLFERCFSGLKNISTQVSNFKKNIKGKWNDFIAGTWFESIGTVSMTTQEDLLSSYISGSYCSTLYAYSHKETFDLYDANNFSSAIKPLSSSTDNEADKGGPIEACTKGADGGCMQYDSFYYNDAGEPCLSEGGEAVQFVCGTYTVIGKKCTDLSDEEKANSDCWEVTTTTTTTTSDTTTDTVNENSVTETTDDTETTETTTTTYTHKCAGNHTIKYCGGHITLKSNAIVYTFTDAQLSGENIVGYVDDDAEEIGVDGQYFQVKVDEDKLNSATDLFGVDTAIHHLATPSDWEGWTASNMEWAVTIYQQDWYELYGLAIGRTAGLGDSQTGRSGGMTDEKLCEELSKITGNTITIGDLPTIFAGEYNQSSVNPVNLRVIADALSFVGELNYNQNYHASPFPDSGSTDCSGFVSNIWLRSGSTIGGVQSTSGLIGLTNGADYSSLQPGDIVVKRNGNSGHTMMFERIDEDGNYVFVHSTPYAGNGKFGPGSIFIKSCTSDYLSAKGYKVAHFQDNYSGSFSFEIE